MQTADTVPIFIDFEASSLSSASYPIEVAWSLADCSVESHLISPAGVSAWVDWDDKAEAVHGIGHAELLARGRSPAWVCRRLLGRIGGARVVYTDCPTLDHTWLNVLFAAVGSAPPRFVLSNVYDLLVRALCPTACGWSQVDELIAGLKRTARARAPGEHRAGWDVQYLVELWRLATERTAAG